jgi:hypothetical protein
MHPLKPHWSQPSHPDVQEVIINEAEFTSKSLSRVDLPPFAVFAKMAFPPCDVAGKATYATVQMGRNKHLNLNSDLLYINHSCEPSLVGSPCCLWLLDVLSPTGLDPGHVPSHGTGDAYLRPLGHSSSMGAAMTNLRCYFNKALTNLADF